MNAKGKTGNMHGSGNKDKPKTEDQKKKSPRVLNYIGRKEKGTWRNW